MKNSLKFLLLLSLVLGFSFKKPDVKSLKIQESCITCNDDLERAINRIKNGANLKVGVLTDRAKIFWR